MFSWLVINWTNQRTFFSNPFQCSFLSCVLFFYFLYCACVCVWCALLISVFIICFHRFMTLFSFNSLIWDPFLKGSIVQLFCHTLSNKIWLLSKNPGKKVCLFILLISWKKNLNKIFCPLKFRENLQEIFREKINIKIELPHTAQSDFLKFFLHKYVD